MANPTKNDFIKLSVVSGLNSYVRKDEIIAIQAMAAEPAKCAVFLRSVSVSGSQSVIADEPAEAVFERLVGKRMRKK
jgi:hypothetical protein